jgi:hypothetical protein
MLRIAEVGFNKFIYLFYLNMPSWHIQVQLFRAVLVLGMHYVANC